MQKRKSLFSLALIVLVLVLAVAMLVACNQDKPKPEYKIVFDNGAGVTTTLTVEEGATIGDYRLPDQSKLGHKFLGWYNGETKFEYDMTFNADTTFVAKFERTGYVITISFEQAGGDDIVAVVDLDDAVLPEDILPDAPILKDKAFKGYYNGDVKAVAGMPITEDVTFVATYYGSEIYTGVFVDEDKKLVAFLEDDFYFGDVLMSREAFKFNTQTGAFEFPKPSFGTGWTLEFVDGKLNLTKITSTGSEVYVMTEAVDDVDYAGSYVKDGSSSMTIYKGGFVKVGDSTPKYQYFKIAADGDGYVLTAVKSAGASVETATVTIDDKGNLTISDIEAGIWIKNGKVEYVISESNSISGKNNETSITKLQAGNEAIYLYKDKDGAQLVTLDKELVKQNGYIVTITLQDNSQIEIQVVEQIREVDEEKISTFSYRFPGEEKGTYTVNSQSTSLTLTFDGYGKAVLAMNGDTLVVNDTYKYFKNEIIIGDSYKAIVSGDSFNLVHKDDYAGEYTVYGIADISRITLNGFGYVKANYNSQVSEGTYVISGNTITITAKITESISNETEVGKDSRFSGTYTILFDGATLYNDEDYWCKSGVDNDISKLKGDWACDGSQLTIDVFSNSITVNFEDTRATNVKILKPNGPVVAFSVDGVTYTVTVGDEANTLKLTWGESNESIYTPKLVVDEAFYGTWSNDDESIKIKIDEDSVSAYFDSEGTLVAANVTAVSAQTTTIVVDGVSYTLSISNGALNVVSSDNTVDDQLQKYIILDDQYFGTWKDSAETITLVVSGKSVLYNGNPVDDLVYDADSSYKIQFVIDGTKYVFFKGGFGSSASYRFQKYDDTQSDEGYYNYTVLEQKSDGGGNVSIEEGYWGTYTWNDADEMIPASGTIVIGENSVTFNGNAVQKLAYEDDEITFEYDGHTYTIESSYGFGYGPKTIYCESSVYGATLTSA